MAVASLPHTVYSRDGSLATLAAEATGFRLERMAGGVLMLRVDRDGEDALFIQVRSVGRDSGLRAVIVGEP